VLSMTERSKVKLLWLRLILDDLYSLLHGWYFHIVTRKAELSWDVSDWYTLAEVSLGINWREELGEVNHSRIHNMGLGCNLINGFLLHPGDVFSLRRVFRDTSAEQGFQAGPIFMHGRTGLITGGGTCLISTLLFNVALHADLDILEKHCHSTDLWGEDRFIDLGLDATYVFGRKDLKFRNSHHSDIIIVTELLRENLLLRGRIISPQPLRHKVSVVTKVLKELYPKAQGQPYRKGWIVASKRVIQGAHDKTCVTYEKVETYKPYVLPIQS
jgi:vancomycin resistance protein VanW